MEGTIFDVKAFAIHDGPGIRTTVFLKGCPLRCLWCHNPEGLSRQAELWHFPNKCIDCRLCAAACPQGAIPAEGPLRIDKSRCRRCGACVAVCPTTALSFDGKTVTVQEVLARVLEDRAFYRSSHGGVTLSGGEPTGQPEFAMALLRACRAEQLSTAIETCMYCGEATWRAFFPLVDSYMVDLKCLNPQQHRAFTGVDNGRILENFRALAVEKEQILVRIPLLPGMTATEENLRAIAAFVRGVRGDIPIELMNYNPLAVGKYRLMDREYCLSSEAAPFSPAEMAAFYELLRAEGAQTAVG